MDTVPKSHECTNGNVSEAHIPRQKSDHSPQAFRDTANLLKDPVLIVNDTGVFCQGFSIREYVGKVRSVSIRKCWPFSERLLEDRLTEGQNQLLPPLDRPHDRWRASQHSVEIDGETQRLGKSFHTLQHHEFQPENNTSMMEEIMVSDVDPGISQELEEQIRKLSTVNISGQEDNSCDKGDVIKRTESKHERSYGNNHRKRSLGSPTATSESTSDGERMPRRVLEEGNAENKATADQNQNQNGKPDTAMHKASLNRRQQVHNFTFDLMKKKNKTFSEVGTGEGTVKLKKARKVAQDQVPEGSILTQCEKSKFDNLNMQGAKSESVRHNIFDINHNEVSGLKVCPVCKTFTSTTVTAVNAHMDHCLSEASTTQKKQGKLQRQKSRMQKKRSIVDIFAAAPPVDSPLDYLEDLATDTSADSSAANCKVKKTIALTDTNVGKEIGDDLTTISCKRKKKIEAHQPAIGKAGKRKRQRFGIISSASKGVKALKMPTAAAHSKKSDYGVEHHLKPSSLTDDARDSNVEQLPSVQVNSVQNCLDKSQHEQPGILMDHICSASMLPKEEKAKEGSVNNNITLVGESGMLLEEENIGEPFSILRMANAIGDVSHPYGMKATAPSQSSHSEHDKSDLLDDSECRHHKACGTDSTRLQLEETSKSEGPNVMNLSSKKPIYEKIKSLNLGKTGEPEKSNGIYAKTEEPEQSNRIYEKSEHSVMHSLEEERSPAQPGISDQHPEAVKSRNEFVAKTKGRNDQQGSVKDNLDDISNSLCMQSIEWEKENSKVLHSPQKEGLIFETRKATDGTRMRNSRLNLNKKVCVLPRDSKGRFLSSHSMNGGIEDDIHYPQQKQRHNYKSTNPPKSLANTSAMEKESNHVKAHLSENASDPHKGRLPGNCSDYGFRGFPLDSQGEIRKHIPNTILGVNQLYRIPNYSAGNEHLISQGTKAFREFNFVESTETIPDVTPINRPLQVSSFNCLPQQNYSIQYKQPECRQENSVFKTNLSNPDKRGSEYSSLLEQIQRDGSSNVGIYGSSIGTPDTVSNLSMQATVQFGYNGDQRQNDIVLEKTYPQVDISRMKKSATQPVMRLMGQSFTIGNENEAGNALKNPQQWNSKDTKSTSGAIVCVSSPMKLMTHYMDHSTACNKGQFCLPKPGANALSQHCKGKVIISKILPNNFKEARNQDMRCSEIIATHEVGTVNNNNPNLVEKSLPTDCVLHGQPLNDQSYSGQAWISSPPFSAPISNMFTSPVSYLCNNTGLNEGQKMAYKDSHVSNQGPPLQKQTYIELLNSCLRQQMFQKQDCNGWKHTGNPCSHPINSDAVQSLPCPISSPGSLSGRLHVDRCALAHSTSFPCERLSHFQTPSSSTSIGDWVEFAKDGRNSCKKKVENESILNALPHTEIPQKWPQKESGLFTRPDNKCLESGIGPSTIGLHYSNAGSPLELAEPMKLSGGAKHILKPSPENGNGKQSLPIHYTLPFSETTAEDREINLEDVTAYRNRHKKQGSPQGSKLMKWSNISSTDLRKL